MWDTLNNATKLSILAGETMIEPSVMLECDSFRKLFNDGASKEACLAFLNENF